MSNQSLINNIIDPLPVAGVAVFRFEISKRSLISFVKAIRSLLANVKTLLSSITVFSDSIHMGSMSPSRTIHLGLENMNCKL